MTQLHLHPNLPIKSAKSGMNKNCPKAVPEIATPETNPLRLLNHLDRVDDMTPILIPDSPTAVTTP